MAVRNMVNDLADGPAFGSIGRIELLVGKAFDSGAEIRWSLINFGLDVSVSGLQWADLRI